MAMEGVTNHQLTSALNSNAEAEDDVVETDPTGRFERYRKSLGKGAYKEVFKAFDQEEGVEVAWNQIRINSLTTPDISRIHTEIQILQSLRNENIINLLYSWRDKDDIFFITEFMSSGSLKGYIRKTKGLIKSKIIRNWCKQILNGLHYLHTRENPIIHRDLKCENIFINGNNGQAKIGDLGLAVVKATQHLSSVLGTPEFMAPELYDENYDEKVDIYAFGMVVLEIATKEYPYSECTNQAQIYRKVTTGVKPAALAQVADEEIRAFIDVCIEHNPKKRPSATELLNHPFFYSSNLQANGGGSFVDLTSLDMLSASSGSFPGTTVLSSQPDPSVSALVSSSILYSSTGATAPSTIPLQHQQQNRSIAMPRNPSTHEVESDQHLFYISRHSTPMKPSATCEVEAIGPINEEEVTLKMVYHTGTSSCEIKFPFNLTDDTATDVVSELVKENLILAIDEQLTRRRIEEAIRGVLRRQGQKTTSEASISSKYEDTLVGGLPDPSKSIPIAIGGVPFASSARIVESPLIDAGPLSSSLTSGGGGAATSSTRVPSLHVPTHSAPSSLEAGGGILAERKLSAPDHLPSIASSSISTIPNQQLSSSIDESLLKTMESQSLSTDFSGLSKSTTTATPTTNTYPNINAAAPLDTLSKSAQAAALPILPDPAFSVVDRQKELSQKLTELQEANLKNFDLSGKKATTPPAPGATSSLNMNTSSSYGGSSSSS